MTIRDLTEKQVEILQKEAWERIKELRKRKDTFNIPDYSLGFSDGAKAILARIKELP